MGSLTAPVLLVAACLVGGAGAAAAQGRAPMDGTRLSCAPTLGTASPGSAEESSNAWTLGTVGAVIGVIALIGLRIMIRRTVSAPTQPRTRRRGTCSENTVRRTTDRRR